VHRRAPPRACVERAGAGEAIAVQVVGRWGGDGSLLAVPLARKEDANGEVTRCGNHWL
jgi:hypothetical protein